MTKTCSRCIQTKNLTEFNKDSKSKDGLKASCKKCISNYSKIYCKKHTIKLKKQSKDWREKNKERFDSYIKIYQEKNKDRLYKKSTEYHKKRYNNDPNFKIRKLLRDRIYKTISNKNVTYKTKKLLGCSFNKFKQYLENQFKPEMTWFNHGLTWEIDHIKPCSSFDLTDIKQQKQCFHFTNFQPLFKTTIIAKSFGYNEVGNRNKLNKD